MALCCRGVPVIVSTPWTCTDTSVRSITATRTLVFHWITLLKSNKKFQARPWKSFPFLTSNPAEHNAGFQDVTWVCFSDFRGRSSPGVMTPPVYQTSASSHLSLYGLNCSWNSTKWHTCCCRGGSEIHWSPAELYWALQIATIYTFIQHLAEACRHLRLCRNKQ